MNRLRIRVELNRRKAGVPMQELVSVVEETHKFFRLLAEDVEIDTERGEWHATSFDPESLNFTAEFDGAASPDQIHAFGSAFGGATSLRRDTIAQFTHIADFIGEDEMVGFGLYQSDQETEPSDWRCLSRRDALRFADEIQMLAKASGESVEEAPLLAVMNGSVGGRRLFKDRRERETLAADPAKWIRDVESSLSRRIAVLESEVETQTRKIQTMENTPDADEKFLKMLGAMESFWSQAPRQLALSAPEPAGNGPDSSAPFASLPLQPRRSRLAWGIGLALASAAMILAAISSKSSAPRRPAQPVQTVSIPPALPVTQSPVLPPLAATNEPKPEPVEPTVAPPRRDVAPEMVHQIALDIPPELRSTVASEVQVNVTVGIDREGKVTTAEVVSAKGEASDVLAPEALKAARWFRFRPARQGKKTVPSQTVLTFVFEPDSTARTPGN